MKIHSLTISFVLFLALLAISTNGNQAVASSPGEAPDVDQAALPADTQIFLPYVLRTTSNYTLTVWNQVVGSQLAAYQEVLDDYHHLHPNVTFDMAKPDDMLAALLATVPKGTGPDIILWANDHIGELGSQNLIVPIDDFLPAGYIANTFEPAAVNGVTYKNMVWAVPDRQEGIALVFNKNVITSSELPDPTDFSDLLLKAEQYQQSHPGKTYLCNQGLGGQDAYHSAPIYFGHGLKNYGGYVDENGAAYMDTPEALAAAEWIDDFRPYGTANGGYSVCQDGLIAGDIAIWWTGPWALGEIKNAGLNYGIAPMGSPFVGIQAYMVTPNAISRGNQPALYSLLQYFGSAAVQKQLTLANSTTPANTTALHDSSVQMMYDIKQFGLALNAGVPMSPSVYSPCQWAPVGEETLNVWIGFKTPANAMADAQAAIESCVAGMP